MSGKNGCRCTSCGNFFTTETLRNFCWAGIRFRWDEKSGALICPGCIEEMRASFINNPAAYHTWVRETLAKPDSFETKT